MGIDYLSMGDPRSPSLLMLHGIGGSAECFQPQMRAFSNDYHVIAWNMPGYGESPPLQPLTFEDLSKSVSALLEGLVISSRVHLLGHSLGGMVAQQFIADYPGKVASLTLAATSAAFGSRDGDFQKRFISERLGPLDQGLSMKQLASSIIDSLIGAGPDPEMLAIARSSMASVPEASYRANMELLVTFDLRRELGKIRVPTLLVAGEKDTNAPPAVMEKMSSYIPNAQFQCIKDAGHLINLEQPSAFNKVLRKFLQSIENTIQSDDENKDIQP
ncbi:MAG: alpha/beta fold hydrolase [Gammaproteobacteria bacterium]|jgi:3-oxoadipate enol-lactonase